MKHNPRYEKLTLAELDRLIKAVNAEIGQGIVDDPEKWEENCATFAALLDELERRGL